MKTASESKIFISYSHRGNGPKWKAALLKALQVLERHGLLDIWEDERIRISSSWDADITQAMGQARLAVVLLTPQALESEYILTKELPFLQRRWQQDKLRVFPVICEPCDWRAHEWLSSIQAPNNSNPLSELSEADVDRVFRKLATDIAEELSQLALRELPKPEPSPTPVLTYLDRFPLTHGAGQREEKLIGREQELALFDLAFAQPHTAIVSLVAWGGVGKTMLVQHWLRRLQREGWFGTRRVYAWSFYSQGTREDRQGSEDSFFAHALEWFGVKCEPTLSPWDKGRLLAEAISHEHTLLILDGIEPLQYPPGPMGGQLRAPGVQSLLKQLARKANSAEQRGLCLVTTREPLTDLADFQDREGLPWGSVLRVDLGNLTGEAGAALLHHAGVNRAGAAEIEPDDKELLAVSREVDGHALTLNLLGRFLARAHIGDIRRRDLVGFEEADRKEQGGTTFKMLASFEKWFARGGELGARQLAILQILSLFDRPADANCIDTLRELPVIGGLTDPLFTTRWDASSGHPIVQPLLQEDWNTATSFVVDCGLAVIQAGDDDGQQQLDCHPLIREYFAAGLRRRNPQAWSSAHRRLFEHLKNYSENQPNDLIGLQRLYDAVIHGCLGQLHQDSFDSVLFSRIRRGREAYSTYKLGAFALDLRALASFFDRCWTKVSPLLRENDQAFVLNEAGFDLRSLGRLSEALEAFQAGLELRIGKKFFEGLAFGPLTITPSQFRQQMQYWESAAIVATNLSELKLAIGNMTGALSDAELSVKLADRCGSWQQRMGRRSTLADVLHQQGKPNESLQYFREAEAIQTDNDPAWPLLYSLQGFRYCDLLLSEAEHAAWRTTIDPRMTTHDARLVKRCKHVFKRAARTRKWAKQAIGASRLDIGLDDLTLARSSLYSSLLNGSWFRIPGLTFERARRNLTSAIEGFRSTVHHIPRGLLSRAWLHHLEHDTERTQADLDEAWDVAERGPMRLHMADIHLHRARLFFRERVYPWKSLQDDLEAAEKLINDCGYHRRDEELADAKRVILEGERP